jgi:hypothetical protein
LRARRIRLAAHQEILGGSDVIVARDIEVALKREDLVDVITGSKRVAANEIGAGIVGRPRAA